MTRFPNHRRAGRLRWEGRGQNITAIIDCKMLLETPDGSKISATIAAGDAYRRSAGVHHNVTNSGDAEMVFIEVEIK